MRSELFTRLRTETAEAHEALERDFNLPSALTSPDAMRRVLERFYGFHVAWEAAMARSPFADFAAERSRLEHLRADLAALGADQASLGALPRCEAAAALAENPAESLGSLYVMEGSTLGGQVISRALKAADWAPAGGLSYFDPYGTETGARWRAFMTWADEAAAHEDPAQVVAGADATFGVLRAWLPTA